MGKKGSESAASAVDARKKNKDDKKASMTKEEYELYKKLKKEKKSATNESSSPTPILAPTAIIKDKRAKDKDNSKKDEKKKEEDARRKAQAAADARRKQLERAQTQKKNKKSGKDSSNYLDGIDLPSEDEDDGSADDEEGASESADALSERQQQMREEENRKQQQQKRREEKEAEKQALKIKRKEEALAMKLQQARAQAIKDDEFAFDVSFENQSQYERVNDELNDSSQVNDELGGGITSTARDIKVEKLTLRAKGKILLDNTSLLIANRRRYGLVGPNGKGKTTLMKMLATRQLPVPEYIDILLVEQEVVGDDRSALVAVVEADQELMELRKEENSINERLAKIDINNEDGNGPETKGNSNTFDKNTPSSNNKSNTEVDELSVRLSELHERLVVKNADAAEGRAAKILNGLGFTPAMQSRPTSSFSGGWRMRISLARALFIEPTCLLLDEPTNHLDLRAVLWLEEYLLRWKKTLIVVSHDREFLNTVSTDIIHLHDYKLHQYRGNYEMFLDMYEMKRSSANKDYEKYMKEIKRAKASGSKANQEKVKNKQKHNQKAKDKGNDVDRSDAAGDFQPSKWHDYSVRFEFPEPTELSPPLIQIIDVEFQYPNREDFKLEKVNVGIDMGTRVAIVGPNGAGKSTLLNLIAGDIVATAGEVRRNQKLRIGRYSQHFVDVLEMDLSAVGYLLERFSSIGLKQEHARAKLGKFGLPGANHLQPICKLSGGQKARVVFAAISLSSPHILMFDEPTNHLDMESVDALAEALIEFQGGVVLVSHDARLISQVCDDERSQVWIVDKGTVTEYGGSFEDYKDELVKEIVAEQDEM